MRAEQPVQIKSYKRHITQMSRKEEKYIRKLIDSKEVYRFSKHLMEKSEERKIKLGTILWGIKGGYDVIEYHRKGSSHRALIRSKQIIKGNQVCVSVDLFSGDIITAYENKVDDNHRTVDWSSYNIKSDVITYIKFNL